MTTLPGGSSAFRNAAVISKDARELSGDDAAHERIKRSIAESRSVVDVRPYVSWVWFPQATILRVWFDRPDYFCRQLHILVPLGLRIVLQIVLFFRGYGG